MLGVPRLARRTCRRPAPRLDLVPLQVADLRGPKTVPVGDQDHGGDAVAIAAEFPGRIHECGQLRNLRYLAPGPRRILGPYASYRPSGVTRLQHRAVKLLNATAPRQNVVYRLRLTRRLPRRRVADPLYRRRVDAELRRSLAHAQAVLTSR